MISARGVLALALSAFSLAPPLLAVARAQEAPKSAPRFSSLEALHASYTRQFAELERRRIADLAALATRQIGPEADAVYRDLFHLAIARDLFAEADPAAERCLSAPSASPDVRALATLITLVAAVDRGQFDQALDGLRSFLKGRTRARGAEKGPDGELVLGIGEAFLQRLIRSGRYDFARKVCSVVCEEAGDPEIMAHFAPRLRQLSLVDRLAPPFAANDVDGKPVRLADFKDKVILIDFWATWCPPSIAALARLNTIRETYQDRGFEILGVNVDAHHEDIRDIKTALPTVRHVLVMHDVSWPNVLNDEGEGDIARAYGVETLPANFLVGRDGTIRAIELNDPELERAIARAVGSPAR
jgi:thiol-disulfide isomerase/thioredoxin